jgi:hypothetical protein
MDQAALWDTFGFFDDCLSHFHDVLLQAGCEVAKSNAPIHTAIAAKGFARFQSAAAWTDEHTSFIRERIEGELSPESLEWFEEDAEAISLFSCFVLGGLSGKLAKGEIDAAGFVLGDAHLSAFVLDNSEQIGKIANNLTIL